MNDEPWPDWPDAGKRVTATCADGRSIVGVLEVDDFFPDGQVDEVPIFVIIEDGTGIRHDYASLDVRELRFEAKT